MNTKEAAANLILMANTIEELELDNIISCEIAGNNDMKVHLQKLTLTGVDATWIERHTFTYPWEKSFTYNNIRFFALYSQAEYEKEQKA